MGCPSHLYPMLRIRQLMWCYRTWISIVLFSLTLSDFQPFCWSASPLQKNVPNPFVVSASLQYSGLKNGSKECSHLIPSNHSLLATSLSTTLPLVSHHEVSCLWQECWYWRGAGIRTGQVSSYCAFFLLCQLWLQRQHTTSQLLQFWIFFWNDQFLTWNCCILSV